MVAPTHGRPPTTRRTLRAVVAALVAAALVLTASPAHAETTSRWADWTFAGSAGAYTGTVQIADTPALAAEITSDSRGGQVGVISGASTWLAEGTPVGAIYGSSRDRPYVNLRPRADTATGASTTTYTFQRPTPVSGWTFALGDIDADAVAIRAIGPDGVELPASALGFRGGFNYCAPGIAGKPSCAGSADDVPVWNAATRTLTGNAAAADTAGSAAWFEPTQPISSLSFVFSRRAGFPVYQTWFASLARDITGTVTDQDAAAPASGVTVRLLDAGGAVIDTTTTDAAGTYAFAGVTATTGYTVEVVPPAETVAVGSARAPADLTSADAVVPFVIRDIVPVPVSGSLRDEADAPLALGGVPVSLTEAGGATLTTVTASDGTWLIDDVPVGTWTASLTAPDGYTLAASPVPIVVPSGSETAISGQDFTLAADPTLSGRVTDGADGVAGVTVAAVGPGGTVTTVTAADGSYAFPRIPVGSYQVTITPPAGFTAPTPTQSVALTDDATLDFVLAADRTGVVTGAVTADDAPLAGAVVRVDGPGAPVALTTGDDGSYSIDGLEPGVYEVSVTTPEGYSATGPTTQSVTITPAGENVEVSFAFAPVVTPTPTPTPSPTPAPAPAPGGDRLPATGGTDAGESPLWGGALIALGAVLVLTTRIRRSVLERDR